MHTDKVIGFIHTMEQFASTVHRLYAKLSRYESDHFFDTLSADDVACFEREAKSTLITLRYLVERLEHYMASENEQEGDNKNGE